MKSTQKPFYLLMVLALLAGLLGFQPARPAEAALPTDLFFSEYIEGGSYNKAIEIYNGTGADVDLTGYDVELYSNGSPTVSQSVTLTGTLLNGDVYVIAHKDAIQAILDQADLQNSTIANWNGDDAIVLRAPDDSVLDVFGVIGEDPATPWGTGDYTTEDHTLVRKPDICGGDPDETDAFDPSIEWISFAKDTTTEIGSHTSNCAPDFFPERFIISEYVEGSSNNKAIELYNGTGEDIDLNGFVLQLYANTSPDPSNPLTWPANSILSNGEAYVITHPFAETALLNLADITSTVAYFNGNDSLVLRRVSDDAVMDSFGKIAENPNGGWGSGDTYTVDRTLVRKETVCSGDTDPNDTFDPALEYNGYATNTYSNLGSHTMTCGPGDQAPTVASTVPADGALNVAVDANITITFSEPVTVTDPGLDPWFTISCTGSSTHTAAVTGDGTVFTLVPDPVFATGETCEVTVLAAKVNDDDLDDEIYDYMEADYVFSFDTVEACGDPFTPIYVIQGSADISPLKGEIVTTQGVVTGDFQNNAAVDSGELNGFFIQDITGDSDPLTSDGIFAYYTPVDVKVGDTVRVTGTIAEYKGLTEIGTITQVLICDSGAATPDPISITMPLESSTWLERYEGVLVTFPDSLTIAEYFNYDRYGNIVLTKGRLSTFTAANEPNIDNFAADNLAFKNNSIKLDDGISSQNPATLRHPDGTAFTKDHYFRGGDLLTGVTGFIDYYEDDYEANYRVQPTVGAQWTPVFSREIISELDLLPGDLKVASFNVLNYFITLDDGVNDICGPNGDMECRGADTEEELIRQRDKLLEALLDIDADIFGLMEIENDRLTGEGDAVADLVTGLNDALGAGTYTYIDTGSVGGDAIKQAILYKPASVTPVGTYQILDSSVDERFIDTKNRPVIAQVFEDNETGEKFVVAVNHLKSKGSPCTDDPDLLDGQGNCNLTRKAAAEAIVDWLADPDYFPNSQKSLIIGDLNSYDKEDPIDMIKLGSDDVTGTTDDYLDMIFEFHGEYAYGYVFDGKFGYLDYALANMELAGNVVDVNFWHINADESDVFDYDMTFKPIEQEALYSVDPYRSSDHDPVIVTLKFNKAPVAVEDAYTTNEDEPLTVLAIDGVLANDTDADGDALTAVLVDDVSNGTLAMTDDGSFVYTPVENFFGTASFTYKAFDGVDYSDIVTVTITVKEVAADDFYIFLPLIMK